VLILCPTVLGEVIAMMAPEQFDGDGIREFRGTLKQTGGLLKGSVDVFLQ